MGYNLSHIPRKKNNLVIFVSPYIHFESVCSQTPPPAVYFVFQA